MTDPTPAPVTIDAILRSLMRRGFYVPHDGTPGLEFNFQALITQILAVQEELGELARAARRDRQDVGPLDWALAQAEAADVVIAAVCLLGAVAGEQSEAAVAEKLLSDEARGWRHAGHRPPLALADMPPAPWITFEDDAGDLAGAELAT